MYYTFQIEDVATEGVDWRIWQFILINGIVYLDWMHHYRKNMGDSKPKIIEVWSRMPLGQHYPKLTAVPIIPDYVLMKSRKHLSNLPFVAGKVRVS